MPLITFGDFEVEATCSVCIEDNWSVEVTYEGNQDVFSVYERLQPGSDGHRDATWLADFHDKDDAILFAKTKSEMK